VFPATSVAVTAPLTAEPSTVSNNGLGIEVEARPDKLSDAVNPIETFELFQSAPLAAGAGEANTMLGGVLSIFTGGDVNVAVLPATSVTVTGPVAAGPSAVTDKGLAAEVEATPDRVSAVLKLKATFVLFHPDAFGPGDG